MTLIMPSTKFTDGSAPPNKKATRAVDKKYLWMTLTPEPLVQIQNNFTNVPHNTPNRFAQMVMPH